MYSSKDHTFVVCAYKESAYLEELIRSLMAQTVKSRILVSTSTPNPWIRSLCDKYGLPMVVNQGESSISKDWNYGYNAAETPLVTIAHQDDIYEPDFLKETLKELNRRKNSEVQIAFTDYFEVKNGAKVYKNKLLTVKRILLLPMRWKKLGEIRFFKRRILSLGNPICCPAVTLNKALLGDTVFDEQYRNSCDYQTWARLAGEKGGFLYVPGKLMGHRIHAESTTTKNVAEGIRKAEDFEIMCQFWPRPIAAAINKLYAKSEESNNV